MFFCDKDACASTHNCPDTQYMGFTSVYPFLFTTAHRKINKMHTKERHGKITVD